MYSEDFSPDQKQKIIGALNTALDRSGIKTDRHWGEVIEDQGEAAKRIADYLAELKVI